MSIIQDMKTFKKVFDNWFSVYINMVVLKRDITCKFKKIGEIKLKGGKNYLDSPLFQRLLDANLKELSPKQIKILKGYLSQIDNEILTVTNIEDDKTFKFLNKELYVIFEVYFYGEYNYVPYGENKSMIDIGANVGDTAIYFANKGYDVHGFEPLPQIYEIAKKNLSLNPELKDKVQFHNKAVSSKKGEITIKFDPRHSGKSSEYENANEMYDNVKEIQIETTTIDEIIEKYDIEPYALKIDCEGCEVNIIKNSDLSMFKEIIMEYHTGITGVDENILIDILKKQGFKVKNKTSQNIGHDGIIGILYMTK